MRINRLFLLVLLVVLISLFSCTKYPNQINLLTDNTSLAIATELYSYENNDVSFNVRHVPFIDDLSVQKYKPDIVIGKHINTLRLIPQFKPIYYPPHLYQSLKGPENKNGENVLIPLSFDLPVIMGLREMAVQLPDPFIVRKDDMRSLDKRYIVRDQGGSIKRMVFLPVWNKQSYIDMLVLDSVFDQDVFTNLQEYDEDFFEIRDRIKVWILESAGNIDDEKEFARRYRYVPDDVLIRDNRILFARTDFHSWVKLRGADVKDFDIRYYFGERYIPVVGINWVGILKSSVNKKISQKFIDWLIEPQTQKTLIRSWEKEGLAVFGFLDGLSSNPDVNRTSVIDQFPELKGFLPQDKYLKIKKILPDRWIRIRDQVVIPWMEQAVYQLEDVGPISETYRRWDMTSLEEIE